MINQNFFKIPRKYNINLYLYQKAGFYTISSMLHNIFFDKFDFKEEKNTKIDILDINKSLIIHNQQKKLKENPELSQNYEKLLYIYNKNISSSDYDLSFVKIGKNGNPIINSCYYETLGVKNNSNRKEIRNNFIKIAKNFHPDKNEKTLEYFTHVCNAYETLMDEIKRAAYDDDVQNFDKAFIITIWKYKFNVFYIFFFSIFYFLSKILVDKYKKLKVYYICPLGEEKFRVENLKNNEKNIEMLKIIETTREKLILENTKKFYEDDEYDYYIDEGHFPPK